MTILELRNKRNKLMQDAQKLLLADNVTTESRAQAHAMIADADVIEADITSLESIEAESRSAGSVRRGEVENGTSAEERNERAKAALIQFMRSGRESLTPEQRTELRAGLTTVNTSEIVPQAFYPTLVEAQLSYGQILNAVGTKKTDTGAPMKIGLVNDTGNPAVIVAEGVTVNEVDPTFASLISSVDEISTTPVLVSLAELQDSAFDLNAWIKSAFAKRWFRLLASKVTNGSTSGNFVGLITAPTGATSASGAAVAYDDLTALFGALDPDYVTNASWSMNSTTRAYLMGVKDGYGRPLFIDNPNVGAFTTLLGRPVVLNQFLPNVGVNNVAIQFGDFSEGYLLRTAGDLAVLRLTERYIDQNMIGFVGYGRAGGNLLDAGTHPVLSLKQAAA